MHLLSPYFSIPISASSCSRARIPLRRETPRRLTIVGTSLGNTNWALSHGRQESAWIVGQYSILGVHWGTLLDVCKLSAFTTHPDEARVIWIILVLIQPLMSNLNERTIVRLSLRLINLKQVPTFWRLTMKLLEIVDTANLKAAYYRMGLTITLANMHA